MSSDGGIFVIIPARSASTRFPGKPLWPLRGAGNKEKPLVQWTYENASRLPGVDAVYIATDSEDIALACIGFGANVIMTSSDCKNGTERCAEALTKINEPCRLVINIQGDAPLTPVVAVKSLIDHALAYPEIDMCTAAIRCTLPQLEILEADAKRGIVGATTVTMNEKGRAFYFSKQLIPHLPVSARRPEVDMFVHIGVYTYSPSILEAYARHPETTLEKLEGLEQLRFLDMGSWVDVVIVDRPAWDIWELNNKSDIPLVEAGLMKMNQP